MDWRRRTSRLLLAVMLTAGLLESLAAGQLPPLGGGGRRLSAEPPTRLAARPEDRRLLVGQQLQLAKQTLQAAQVGPDKPPERLTQEVELLKQIETVLAQLTAAAETGQDLQSQVDALKQQAEQTTTTEPEEISFIELDEMRDELTARAARTELIESSVATAAAAVETAKKNCEEKEAALRLVKESNPEPATDEAKALVKEAELAARLCRETLNLRKQQLANEQAAAEIHQIEKQLLEARINQLAGQVRFQADDLEDKLVELDKQEVDLQRSLETLQSDLEYAERQLYDARSRFDAALPPAAALQEEVEVRRLARQLLQQRMAAANYRLQQVSNDRGTWKRRLAVINETATTEELITWQREAEDAIQDLDRDARIQQQRIEEARNEIALRDAKLRVEGVAPETRRWLEEQQLKLQQLMQVYDRLIADMTASRRLQAKLLGEIEGDVSNWTFSEWVATAGHYLSRFWNTELAKVDERPITVGKVILGVLLIFCGLIMARMLSRLLGGRLTQFGLDQGGVSALQSVAFYSLLILFTLTSLRFVNVPLTVFTLLGGAVAIGIGFGSQNIINNFISGLILLAERPIKVGDLIQLEELFGNVIKIGARSTQIRTGENLDIIIPNSKFLENNVINLTLGNDKIRTKIHVGVIYGSPTREVAKLLEQVANDHNKVLRHPAPFVWFVDFGDNSLNFQVHFWVKARTMADRIRIESDLRYEIDRVFREAEIVIAFPQRDVHLDTMRPLDIRLLSDDGSALGGRAA